MRAFGREEAVLTDFLAMVDVNTRVYMMFNYAARWLGFILNMIVTVVVVATILFGIEWSSASNAASMGLALTYLMFLAGLLQYVRVYVISILVFCFCSSVNVGNVGMRECLNA